MATCFAVGDPTGVEVNDCAGFEERYHYRRIQPTEKLDQTVFEDV
jgi:hypothetical protein